jgi:hypothetical protein
MSKDAVVDEIRAARDEYAKRFGYDIEAICRDLREREAGSGHEVVSLPPKPWTTVEDEGKAKERAP